MLKNFKIIVANEKRVGEYFNLQFEHGIDLTKIADKKVQNFLEQYEPLLTSTKIKDFNKLYEETGLIVTHLIKTKQDSAFELYIDSIGICKANDMDNILPSVEENKYKVCNHHLLVISNVHELIEENSKIYAISNHRKKDIFELNQRYQTFKNNLSIMEVKCRKIRYASCFSKDIKNQINIIKKEIGENKQNYIKEENIKQIECIYPFNQFLIVLKDGALYLNDKLYGHNVREICVMNSYESYIIYYDNTVEQYSFKRTFNSEITKNKKVICENGFLATLNTDNHLLVTTVFENMGDELTHLYFDNIDNIEYNKQEEYLIMEKNNEKIRMSTSPLFIFYN